MWSIWAALDPCLKTIPLFPERANIEMAKVVARDHVIVNVWERGAGLTKACGTAACAVMAAGFRIKMIDRAARVTLPGGDLMMSINEETGHVIMTGPLEYEYEGVIPEGLLA
jgi:diaminopimelate epimerase